MPRTSKNKASEESDPVPTFEQALGELETIVEKMENEQLPLNELIDQYEKGTRLFTACDQLLGQARERLELITLKAREDHSANAGPSADTDSAADDDEPDDDDIRLF